MPVPPPPLAALPRPKGRGATKCPSSVPSYSRPPNSPITQRTHPPIIVPLLVLVLGWVSAPKLFQGLNAHHDLQARDLRNKKEKIRKEKKSRGPNSPLPTTR